MAAGKPVIASDLACNSELIEHGVDGLLFRNGDADQLAERVRELQRGDWALDPERLRERVARLSDSRMGAAYLALYQRYLPQRRVRPAA